MNHSRYLPIAFGALIAALPTFSPVASTASVDSIAIPEVAPVHPHHPMVTSLAGVQGNLKLSWFTVPFNPEQVKKAGPNYVWYRGFSLTTAVALQCGDVLVPAGNYGFGFQLDGAGKEWSVLLVATELTQLQRQLRRAEGRGRDTTEIKARIAKLTEAGVKNFKLPSATFQAGEAEHMAIQAINYGYKMSGRGRNAKPISGIDGEFRISFGDLHTSFKFSEVLGNAKAETGEKKHKEERKGEHGDEKKHGRR